MFREHQFCDWPRPNMIVWRYMEFANFAWTLERSALHFTRIDALQDRFEGSFLSLIGTEDFFENLEEEQKNAWTKAATYSKQRLAVNCWSMSPNESRAMWKDYGPTTGVAIVSTFQDLSDALAGTRPVGSGRPSCHFVYAGKIQYRHHGEFLYQQNRGWSPLSTIMLKRPAFEYEQELRVVIEAIFAGEVLPDDGEDMTIDLEQLILGVYLSPFAPKWLYCLVAELLRKSNLNVPILKSELGLYPSV